MKRLFTFLFSVVLVTSWAQGFNSDQLDNLLDSLAIHDQGMGSLALVRNGKRIYSKSVGYTYMSGYNKLPATEFTRYRLGTLSQMITAVMIFQLIEEGKLSLTTTLDKFYPQFGNSDKITIEHLLRHRTGLYNFTDDVLYKGWMHKPQTEKVMIGVMSYYSPSFKPDEKFEYSTTNYVLLGYILNKITRRSYNKNLKRRISARAGLTNTYFGSRGKIGDGEALSYYYTTTWKQTHETNLLNLGTAGSLLSTPTDMAMFMDALFSGKLISGASLLQMQTLRDGRGIGLLELPHHSKIAYGLHGQIDGSASEVFYFPEDQLAIAYCSNGVVCPLNTIILDALNIYFKIP
jgi:D-alanyl-D-alanine carboxypeptidase